MKNTILKINILVCLYFIIFLCSCGVQKKLFVNPANPIDFWEEGRGYLVKSNENVEIIICIEDFNMNELVFYVEITNKDSESISIDPSKFYYTYKSNIISKNGKQHNPRVVAKNPEKEIDKVNNSMHQEEESYATSNAVNTGCLCGGGILTIFSLFSGDAENAEDGVEIIGESLNRMEVDEINHENEMNRLANERVFWINETLHKDTLLCDETIGGIVIFPFSKKAKEYSIHFPLHNSNLCFNYSQRWEEI